MNRSIYFYNLCEQGISYRMIENIVKLNITPKDIIGMNLLDFGRIYGVKKSDLFSALKEYALYGDKCIENLSLYSLMYVGISNNVVEHVISKGINKVIFFILTPQKIIKDKYGIKDLEYKKVMEGIAKLAILDEIDFGNSTSIKIIADLDNDSLYLTELKKEILAIVNNSNKEILMYSEIVNSLDYCFKNSNRILDIISELAYEKKLEFTEFGIKKYGYSLLEFVDVINNKDPRAKKFFEEYLDGKTYEQIGKENEDLSRERVRQIIGKITFPELLEDKYYEYFRKYDFDENSFVKVFNLDPKVYRYFEYKCKHREWIKIDELIDDPNTSEELKNKLESLNPKLIYINGKKYSKKMSSLLKAYLQNNSNEIFSMDELYEKFKVYWEELTSEKFDKAKRSFQHAVELMDLTILSKKGWRYFKVNSLEMSDFFEELDISEFKNKEVDAHIIYDQYKNLMNEFDVRDNYELHSIMRKSEKFDYIDFGRIPILKIGNCDKDEQIKDLLIELSPVSAKDFVKEYKKRYGCHEGTLNAYIISNFGKYYNNQIFDVSTTIISDLEVFKWQKLLTDDFYFHEDIKKIAVENDLTTTSDIFKRINLNRIGFISNGAYIFSNKYVSAADYFETFFNGDVIDLSGIDKRILSIVAFTGILYSKIRSMQIFEFANRKFINISRLESIGVCKEDIYDFASKVKRIVKDKVFTIQSLINEGFDHELLDLGFDNMFYSSLLISTNDFAYRRSHNVNEVILRNVIVDQRVKTVDLLFQEVYSRRFINIYDLLEILNEQYGFTHFDTSKIRSIISETDLFYDDISENIYCDYDTYFELI